MILTKIKAPLDNRSLTARGLFLLWKPPGETDIIATCIKRMCAMQHDMGAWRNWQTQGT